MRKISKEDPGQMALQLKVLDERSRSQLKDESVQCQFLWGDEDRKGLYHLVKWEEVKLSLEQGGLGLKSFVDMNRAFYGKWIWRYWRKEDNFWGRVVDVKLGGTGGWLPQRCEQILWGGIKEEDNAETTQCARMY